MSQQFRLVMFVTAILLIGPMRFTFGAEASGTWTDSRGRVTYSFLEGNQFRFEQKFRVKSGNAEVWKPSKAEGVWQSATEICWLGSKGEGRSGNLMVYVDTMQCCFSGQMLGGRFVLTRIWKKGYAGYAGFNICTNRVLKPLSTKRDAK